MEKEKEKEGGGGRHAVIMALPGKGHLRPTMELAKRLADPPLSFFITFLTSHRTIPSLLNNNNNTNSNKFRLRGIPDGQPPDFELCYKTFLPFLDSIAAPSNIDAIKKIIMGCNDKGGEEGERGGDMAMAPAPSCLIADAFFPWVGELASKLNLPHVSFCTSSAAYLAAEIALSSNSHPHQRCQGNLAIKKILGLDLPEEDLKYMLPSYFARVENPAFLGFQASKRVAIEKASCLLINSVYELEASFIDSLRATIHGPVLAVGPLLPLEFLSTRKKEEMRGEDYSSSLIPFREDDEESKCLRWLDGQAARSVLYVSFGSFAELPKRHMIELAHGVELAGQPFLWVLRGASLKSLPEGFQACVVAQRGHIVSWAPQVRVLAHPSTGAFLTHCGWNSTLEGLTLGVPMICWPLFGDQWINSWLPTDNWFTGIKLKLEEEPEFCEDNVENIGKKTRIVSRYEIERVVRLLVQSSHGISIQEQASLRRGVALEATRGSSHRNLECFVQLVGKHTSKNL